MLLLAESERAAHHRRLTGLNDFSVTNVTLDRIRGAANDVNSQTIPGTAAKIRRYCDTLGSEDLAGQYCNLMATQREKAGKSPSLRPLVYIMKHRKFSFMVGLRLCRVVYADDKCFLRSGYDKFSYSWCDLRAKT